MRCGSPSIDLLHHCQELHRIGEFTTRGDFFQADLAIAVDDADDRHAAVSSAFRCPAPETWPASRATTPSVSFMPPQSMLKPLCIGPWNISLRSSLPAPSAALAMSIIPLNDKEIFHLTPESHSSIMRLTFVIKASKHQEKQCRVMRAESCITLAFSPQYA